MRAGAAWPELSRITGPVGTSEPRGSGPRSGSTRVQTSVRLSASHAGSGRGRQVQAVGEPPRLGRGALGDPELDAVRPGVGEGETGAVGGPPQVGDAGPLGQAGDLALGEIGEAHQPQARHIGAAARGMVPRPEAEPAQAQLPLRQLRDGRQAGAVEDQQPLPLGIELDRRASAARRRCRPGPSAACGRRYQPMGRLPRLPRRLGSAGRRPRELSPGRGRAPGPAEGVKAEGLHAGESPFGGR